MKNQIYSKRVLAQIIDIVFYYLASFLIALCISGIFFLGYIVIKQIDLKKTLLLISVIVFSLSFILSYIYLNIKHLTKNRSTIGYRMLHLSLTNDDNSTIPTHKIILRLIVKILLYMISYLFIGMLIHVIVLIISKGEKDLLDHI